jgi:hypothetical protein
MKLRPVGAAVVAATLMLGIPVRAQDRYPSSAITVVTLCCPWMMSGAQPIWLSRFTTGMPQRRSPSVSPPPT